MPRRYHRRRSFKKWRTPEEIAREEQYNEQRRLSLAKEKAESDRRWRRAKRIIIICSLAFAVFKYGPVLRNGLTHSDVLFERYKEDRLTPNKIRECVKHSRRIFRIGAVCSDGRRSGATGQGACSHHGGVARWIMDTAYVQDETSCRRLILEQCERDALKHSWLGKSSIDP